EGAAGPSQASQTLPSESARPRQDGPGRRAGIGPVCSLQEVASLSREDRGPGALDPTARGPQGDLCQPGDPPAAPAGAALRPRSPRTRDAGAAGRTQTTRPPDRAGERLLAS